MGKLYIILILLVAAVVWIQCSDSKVADSSDADIEAELSETIAMWYGEVASIVSEDLVFGLTEQMELSSCPVEDYFSWNGQAEAGFWILEDNGDTLYTSVVFSTHGLCQTHFGQIPCYLLIIDSIAPYPWESWVNPLVSCRVSLRVEKIECFDNSTGIKPVQMTALPLGEFESDGYVLNSAQIAGDSMSLNVTYSGGCKPHEFILYMKPYFYNSDPMEADLYLHHNDYQDECQTEITEDIVFDLGPVAERYRDYYGHYDDIQLNINDTPNNDSLSVVYTP